MLEHFNNSDVVLDRELANHYGRGNAKSLKVEHKEGALIYIVIDHGDVIYTGLSSFDAVNTYNDIKKGVIKC